MTNADASVPSPEKVSEVVNTLYTAVADNHSPDVKEADLARKIGIDRKQVISAREKIAKSLWYREQAGGRPTKFGVVWLKAAGVRAICETLGLKQEDVPSAEKISAANAAGEVTVIRADFPNRRIVQVETSDNKRKMMRVKDARMWVQGMKVMARPEGALDITLVPLRHPRFRGRF
jgi:hypothetical protein